MPSRKRIPGNYFYFADITFQNGSKQHLRFASKSLRQKAVADYKKKFYIRKAELSEGYEE